MSERTPKNFALIGAAGYVAPRHMKAIVDTGNRLVAALDPNDSVGILDKYAPECAFFTEFERFDRHCEKLRRRGGEHRIHYVSICSPNYLHDAHCRFALRIGADAICEKPLVLNPWNADALAKLEIETDQRIWNVLQLRLHPSVQQLKTMVDNAPPDEQFEIDLAYITSRGKWYFSSWKGDVEKSGGIATNIGVHFFDMLIWIFGRVQSSQVFVNTSESMKGRIVLERAIVNWHLSVDASELPPESRGKPTWRSIKLNEIEFEFSDGFTDLHSMVYEKILEGNGFGLSEARSAIKLVHELRGKGSG